MRFVHISDTHIGPTADFSHYGHAPLPNLEFIVDAVNALRFPVDFVLHGGDVVEDGSEEAYRLAQRALSRLRVPVLYVAGNHDNPPALQRIILGKEPSQERMDYATVVDGIHVVVLDTRGPQDPTGMLTNHQITRLREICTPKGPPLVIALHHPPLDLDCLWLAVGWATPEGRKPTMLLDQGPAFLEALSPARERIRGVFFGHVHRSYQIMHRGILFSSAPSGFAQLLTWPDADYPNASPDEPAGFSLVTIDQDKTTISQHALPRPR